MQFRKRFPKISGAVAIETEVPENALDATAEAKDGCPVEAIEAV